MPIRGLATKSKNGTTQRFEFLRPFKGHRLDTLPDNFAEVSKQELMDFFRTMTYYRRFEIAADEMYKQRMIRGFCHLYDGQEAIVTGMEAAIKKSDSVITAYRAHCHQLARGGTGVSTMAELLGREAGCSRGKGGSMHLYHIPGKFYGGNGIVGAQVPLGAGLAFAHKYQQDGGVAIACYGDGASNQGQIFEAANMAALWKLPLIFVCENNQYGMGTAVSRSSSNTDFYTRGDVIPGIWIDGMDVLAVKKGFEFAAEHCRSGKGPIFVEANTYRYHGHSMSDPGIAYRKKEEVDKVRQERDCILLVRNRLLSTGLATEDELKVVEKEVRKQVNEEVEQAKASPELPGSELYSDIYAEGRPSFIRTVEYENSLRS